MSTLRPKRLEKRDRSDASMRPKRLKNKTEANARPYSDTPNIFLPSEDGPRSGKCFQDRNVWKTQIYPRHFCGLQVIRTKNKKMYCNCNHLPNGMQLIYILYKQLWGFQRCPWPRADNSWSPDTKDSSSTTWWESCTNKTSFVAARGVCFRF